MKRAAVYVRVSTVDQHPETQVYDLRELAKTLASPAALKKPCDAVGPAQVRPRNSIAGRRGVARQNPPRLH